jgi:hypothetical protein
MEKSTPGKGVKLVQMILSTDYLGACGARNTLNDFLGKAQVNVKC